ncbi:MAG: hypothetical protein QM773_18740 [Hyphomonadaceae bacterium]
MAAHGRASGARASLHAPAITQHEIKLQKRTLSYSAEAGLTPIRSADGSAT